MNGMTKQLPGLLDDPQFQHADLPALKDFHLPPLRDPAPSSSRNVFAPLPLEPLTEIPIVHHSVSSSQPTLLPPPLPSSSALQSTANQVTRQSPRKVDSFPTEKRRTTPKISPSDVLSARESKKPHLAISELLEGNKGTDIVPVQLPSFISLAVVEKSPIQRPLAIDYAANAHKRLKLDLDSDLLSHGTTRHLPRPSKREEPLPRPAPLLPAMVTGLHQPPPSAALLPSMELDSRANLNKNAPTSASRIEFRNILSTLVVDSPAASPKHVFSPQDDTLSNIKPMEEAVLGPARNTLISPFGRENSALVMKNKKVRRVRRKWSNEETRDLMAGLKKYGVGKWKQILEDPTFKFCERNSVDLKDRYRVCSKDEGLFSQTFDAEDDSLQNKTYLSYTSLPTRPEQHFITQKLAEHGTSGSDLKPLLSLSVNTTQAVDENSETIEKQRRKRRAWTPGEDEALLKGVAKHGFQWTAIHDDPELDLGHRRATDLRDRIRNKFPEGYKHAESAPLKCEQRQVEKATTLYEFKGGNILVISNDKIEPLPPQTAASNALTIGLWNGTALNEKDATFKPTSTVSMPTNANSSKVPVMKTTLALSKSNGSTEPIRTSFGINEGDKDQSGVTLPSLTLDEGGLDWGDNRLPPLLDWDDL